MSGGSSRDLGAPDPWVALAAFTPARIAVGRVGPALPTRAVLELALAHARARDAVHAALDAAPITAALGGLGLTVVEVSSAATMREEYLRRPDLGRRVSPESRKRLREHARRPVDVALVIADGLSATAVQSHAVHLIEALLPYLNAAGLTVGPVVVAHQGRVALGDEVGELLSARLAVMLIGERPGLSAADSLGAYLTYAPRTGRSDAERNCVSNIRGGGLGFGEAALKLGWLAVEALRRGISGVALKDDSNRLAVDGQASAPALRAGPA